MRRNDRMGATPRAAVGLAFALLVSGLSVTPALGVGSAPGSQSESTSAPPTRVIAVNTPSSMRAVPRVARSFSAGAAAAPARRLRSVVSARDSGAPPALAQSTTSLPQTDSSPTVSALPPNFSIATTPSAQTVADGDSATYGISIQQLGGFIDPVSLSVELPDGTSGSFNPNPATTFSTLTVTTTTATSSGFHLLQVTGVSGNLSHTSYVTVTVPDFSLSPSPASQTVQVLQSTSYTISIEPVDGFNAPVSLSVDGLPAGASASFSPNPASSSSVLSVTAGGNASAPIVLTITGVGGGLTHTTSVTLLVAPAPPPPPPNLCGAPPNPWGYNFCGGSFITSPPTNFCDYFACIPSFWISTNGHVEECIDGMYSHSGGQSGSCSTHGGNWRALLSP